MDTEGAPEIINGRYRLVRVIGRGGMGKVALAQDLAEGSREVALKSVQREQGKDDLAHVQHEFLTLSRLKHPNVAEVYDFGVIEGTGEVFFTTEYVPGIDLLEATARATWEQLTDWIVQICRGLEYVHSRGLIHYDVKPGNVLVTKPETGSLVKIIDFGLAGSRAPLPQGVIKGTVSYMAPEVAKSGPVDKRADLYSLGCTLFHCVTRDLPFRGDTNLEVIQRHLNEPPRDPKALRADLPEHLRALVLRLMSKEPGERFASANDVIRWINETTGRSFEVETKAAAAFWVASGSFVGRDSEFSLLARAFEHAIGTPEEPSAEAPATPPRAVEKKKPSKENASTAASLEIDFGDAPKPPPRPSPASGGGSERAASSSTTVPSPALPPSGRGSAGEGVAPRRLVLVSGEAGAGKSRLLREFKTWAQLRQVAVVEGRAAKGGAPYAPFAQAFRGILHLFPGRQKGDGRDALRQRLLRHYGAQIARLIPEVELEGTGGAATAVLAPEQERLRLLDALAQFLLRFAQSRPLVVFLHDLHEADEETTELLRYLARNLELAERARDMAPRFGLTPPLPLRLLVIASFRSTDAEDRPLASALEELRRSGEATELRLGRLAATDVERLVGSMLGVDANPRALAQRVYQETKGNPFFVVELMRSLVEAGAIKAKDGAWRARLDEPGALRIPATVADVILDRVRRLTPEERSCLELLAVQGRPASALELARLDGAPDRLEAIIDRLDALERRQIVIAERGEDGTLVHSFIHDLARDAIHEELPRERRRALHARAGHLLEAEVDDAENAAGGASADLVQLVRHFEEADEPARALEFAVRAGDLARGLYASREAIAHYDRALALAKRAEATPSRRRLDLLERLADALALAGDYERAASVMEELRAASLAPDGTALEPRERARIERRVGELQEKRGAYDDALEAFARGTAALGADVRSREGAQLFGATASVYVKKGLYQQGVEFCEAGLEMLKGFPEEGGEVAQLRTILGVARSCRGELELAEKEFERALHARRRANDAIGTARSLANLGAVAVERGQLDEAVERFEAALELEEKLEHAPGIAEAASQLARALRARGDFERAIGLSRRALAIQEKTGDAEGQVASWNDLGALHDALGEYARALECFRAASSRNERVGEAREQARALNGEALVLSRAGAFVKAEPLANEALRLASLHSIRREEARAYRTLARIALAKGSLDEAEQLAQSAVVQYLRLGSRRDVVLVTLEVVKACTERGDHELVERMLGEVEHEARTLGFDRIEAAYVLAKAWAKLRKGGASRDELRALVLDVERAASIADRSRARETQWRLEAVRGMLLGEAGDLDDAAAAYVRAMEGVRALHSALPSDLRATYLEDPERKALRESFRALRARMQEGK